MSSMLSKMKKREIVDRATLLANDPRVWERLVEEVLEEVASVELQLAAEPTEEEQDQAAFEEAMRPYGVRGLPKRRLRSSIEH